MINRKIVLRQVVETMLIFLIGGAFNAYLTCSSCFSDLKKASIIWAFCGTMWILLWKGNELITCEIDKRISWIREPGKRFLIGISSMLLYTLSAVSLNTWLFIDHLFPVDFNISFRGSIMQIMVYSIAITVLIMLIFLSKNFFQSWRQAAINEEKLRRENITSQYEALKNQVNPHFLFNTLNALSSLIYENKEKAVQFINKFSEVYRYVLDSKDKEVVPVADEIMFVKSYMYLLNSRYEKNLEINIDENLQGGYVPPMSVQLLVENAVKHNIIADDSPITISIKKARDYIVIENSMNLKIKESKNNGLGLENIKSRYSILSDKPVQIRNDGSLFSVSIPILELKK